MSKFRTDSLNGLVYKLSDKVSELVKTDKQQIDIQEIFNEIARRIQNQDEELAEIIENIENTRGML